MVKTFIAAVLLGFLAGGSASPQDGVQVVHARGLSAVQQPDGSFQVVPEDLVVEALDAALDGSQSAKTTVTDPVSGDTVDIVTVRGGLETEDHWHERHWDAVQGWKLFFANRALKKSVTGSR